VQLANELLKQVDAMFGLHPGFRALHPKGMMLSGTFTPARQAASLIRALHITRSSTQVMARFSDGTGLPEIPDNSPDSNPKGLAIRFHLADHDIVSHSTDGFPTRTGQEFLEFLRAAAGGDPSAFLAAHPAALAFVQTPISRKLRNRSLLRVEEYAPNRSEYYYPDRSARTG
jgi:catalase